MGRKKTWFAPKAFPPGVAPVYEWRATDGAIRQGTYTLIDIHKDGLVLVNLRLTSGRLMLFRKLDVIATFIEGRSPKPVECFNCGARIRYESVGRMDLPNWPERVRWVPKDLYHGDTCLEALMQEFPIHSEWDPIGRAKRDGRKKARYYDGNQSNDESE